MLPYHAIKAVTATLIQSEKYGTRHLHSPSEFLSDEFRNERFMRAEAKAARLPAVMTIPLDFIHSTDTFLSFLWGRLLAKSMINFLMAASNKHLLFNFTSY